MKKSHLILVLVVVAIFCQALTPWWGPHLVSDVNNYHFKAKYLLENGNLTNLPVNEYQPGAIFYLMSFSSFLYIENTVEFYRLIFSIANALIVLGIGWFYLAKRGVRAQVFFAFLILSIGPVVLYRFEMLVVSLFIAAVYFWTQSKTNLSYFFLGLATSVKVYPIVTLPYFLLLSFKKRGLEAVFKNLICFSLGVILPTSFYIYIFKVDFNSLKEGLVFHGNKPIDTEGIWSSLHTTYYLLTQGSFPDSAAAWGINGITEQFTIGPIWMYNSFWILALGTIYFLVLLKKSLWEKFNLSVIIAILLTFLVFSKVMAPQYLIWVFLLFPLINPSDLKDKFWQINLILAVAVMFLYQIIYPLNFDGWLDAYHNRSFTNLYWINLLRNIILVWLLYRIVRGLSYATNKK